MKNRFVWAGTILFALSSAVVTAEQTVIGDVAMPEVKSSAAFKQIKKKVGKWQGEMTQGLTGKVIPVSYEWKVTSGGNTITETIVEDGVEMLTTYSDKNGELVAQHYCALGTEPIFRVSNMSSDTLALELDATASGLHAEHDSFVTHMQWTMQGNNDTMLFKNTVMLDGQVTQNTAKLNKVH